MGKRHAMLTFVAGCFLIAFGIYILWAREAASAPCRWHEPRRTYPSGERWECVATRITDGDTFWARCTGHPERIAVRVRGLDADERGDPRWDAARQELRHRVEGHALTVAPHHQSYERVVADVFANGQNIGAQMDTAGWSKADCPKR